MKELNMLELILKRRFWGWDYTIGSFDLSPDNLSPTPSPQGRGEFTATDSATVAAMYEFESISILCRSVTLPASCESAPLPCGEGQGGEVIEIKIINNYIIHINKSL
jgi:hypothetical protein